MKEFIVSNLSDENDGDFSEGNLSLREAIALANESEGKDTITFDPDLGGGTITLVKDQSSGRPTLINAPLSITDSVTIDGLGTNNLTIDGNNGGSGIFELGGNNEIEVTVEGVTLANGAQEAFFFPGVSDPGGTFFVSGNANLTLENSVITGSGSSIGGAINNNGNTTIVNSTISDSSSGNGNTSPSPTGNEGIIVNRSNLDVVNSTIANNAATAIVNRADGSADISNSTIVNNQGGTIAGGISNDGGVFLSSTIVANSASGSGVEIFDSSNENLLIAIVENIHAGDMTIHDFV